MCSASKANGSRKEQTDRQGKNKIEKWNTFVQPGKQMDRERNI